MEKINLGVGIPAYPMPVSLVGAHVDGRPNFLTIAWFTMASYKPPMIKDCPVSVECRLNKVIENGLNEMFIGEIIGVYTEDRYLTEGKLDFQKMKPLILSQPDTGYWNLGEKIAKAWSVGKHYKKAIR